jgi:radical SAM superfamily enzyme YgiQ (UPF0313 family)
MKKVLLVMQAAAKKDNFVNALPPLGILYISSFLDSMGIASDVIDYNIAEAPYSAAKDYDLVCFSVNCGNVTRTLEMCRHVKDNYGKKVIVGGPLTTSDPGFFMEKEYVDGAVVGEGEYALYEYIRGARPVSGMYLKDENGRAVFGGERPHIKGLDHLPFPALNKIDIRKYNTIPKKGRPVSTITTSRGCPYSCIFCFHSLGHAYRMRSAENVVAEIEWQVKELGVKEIGILDDNISLDMDRAKRIFKEISAKKLDVSFILYNGIRVDRVDEELLGLMKKANVWMMSVSPESGDPESNTLMKKGFDNEKVMKVVEMSKRMGFFTYACFMIGFPWEMEEHIRRTIDFAMKLDTDLVQFARVVAFPNTELYDMCKLNYRIEKDIGLFYSDPKFSISKLTNERLDKFIKEAYRKFYFRPRKAMRLLGGLRWDDIYTLAKYSVKTKSI